MNSTCPARRTIPLLQNVRNISSWWLARNRTEAPPMNSSARRRAFLMNWASPGRKVFVDGNRFGPDRRGRPEREPGPHAGRVRADRQVEEFAQLAEFADVGQCLGHLLLRDAAEHAADADRLDTRHVVVDSQVEIEQRHHADVRFELPDVGR